jgi:hypothetical protein
MDWSTSSEQAPGPTSAASRFAELCDISRFAELCDISRFAELRDIMLCR